MDDESFWALTADLERQARADQGSEAVDIVAGGRREQRLPDVLRAVPSGDLVSVATVDGWVATGRVLGVGADHLELGEVGEREGTARARFLRLHRIPFTAIARLTAESGP